LTGNGVGRDPAVPESITANLVSSNAGRMDFGRAAWPRRAMDGAKSNRQRARLPRMVKLTSGILP
jgi:hypothetical protein